MRRELGLMRHACLVFMLAGDDRPGHVEQQGRHRQAGRRQTVFIDSNSWVSKSCDRVPQPVPRLPSLQHPLLGHPPMSGLSTRAWHPLTLPPLDSGFDREFRPPVDLAISVSKMGCSLKPQT
jgi:hypothetical protein